MENKLQTQEEQSLQLEKRQELIAEAKQLIQHKPYLVKIIDKESKIKDLDIVEQETGNETLITYLLSLLGISTVEGDGKELHYLAVDQYITENLGKYTYGEIREAFNMLLRGEFKHLKEMEGFKLFNKLDCILLSKVIECYDIQKKIILRIYDSQLKRNILLLESRDNELSQEEKDEIVYNGVIDCFRHYKETGEFEFGKRYVYEVLEEKRLLNRDWDYRTSIMKKVRKRLETPIEEVKKVKGKGVKKAIEVLRKLDSNEELNKSKKPVTEEEVIKESKMLVLAEYFDTLIKEDKSIEDVL